MTNCSVTLRSHLIMSLFSEPCVDRQRTLQEQFQCRNDSRRLNMQCHRELADTDSIKGRLEKTWPWSERGDQKKVPFGMEERRACLNADENNDPEEREGRRQVTGVNRQGDVLRRRENRQHVVYMWPTCYMFLGGRFWIHKCIEKNFQAVEGKSALWIYTCMLICSIAEVFYMKQY